MDRLLLVAALVAGAGVVALLLSRRQRPDAPTQPTSWTVPAQLDRADFRDPATPWLVVVFSSATCDACAGTHAKAVALESEAVAVEEVTFQERRDLHERYRVDAVPLVLVAGPDGAVQASFVGEPTATDLWATVAELREPGSVPPGCDHGQGAAADD
jgi:hypothetical protein